MKKQHEFKPFERVLVRDDRKMPWHPALFGYHHEGCFPYATIGGRAYAQCLPYEGNEALCGTTGTPLAEGQKPEVGQPYFFVWWWEKGRPFCVNTDVWHGSAENENDWLRGNVFLTYEAARAMADRINDMMVLNKYSHAEEK